MGHHHRIGCAGRAFPSVLLPVYRCASFGPHEGSFPCRPTGQGCLHTTVHRAVRYGLHRCPSPIQGTPASARTSSVRIAFGPAHVHVGPGPAGSSTGARTPPGSVDTLVLSRRATIRKGPLLLRTHGHTFPVISGAAPRLAERIGHARHGGRRSCCAGPARALDGGCTCRTGRGRLVLVVERLHRALRRPICDPITGEPVQMTGRRCSDGPWVLGPAMCGRPSMVRSFGPVPIP